MEWETIHSEFRVCRPEVRPVDKLSKSGNPKHGQVWGYENELSKFMF